MSILISLFTRNWGLKLLALALALIVFYGVRGSIRNPRTDNAPSPGFFMKGVPNANSAQ